MANKKEHCKEMQRMIGLKERPLAAGRRCAFERCRQVAAEAGQ